MYLLKWISQCGPVEDHSWHNEVPILCYIFNLNQNSNYEAATTIAVLGDSYITGHYCCPKTGRAMQLIKLTLARQGGYWFRERINHTRCNFQILQ